MHYIALFFAIIAADLDPVSVDQFAHQVSAITVPVTLDAANLVEEGTQDPGVGIAHAGEGIGRMAVDRIRDRGAAFILCPFVQPALGVVNVAVEEGAVVRIVQDLPDGRARALWRHPIQK